jgi:quercetin dioxygenase-like cupin family protein
MNPELQIKGKLDSWESSDLIRGIRWQFSVNAGITVSNGLSCGYLQVDPDAELPLHYHKEQEIYVITQGNAELLTGATSSRAVTTGDTIYIPENSWHGIKNISQFIVEFIWIFPTDTWQEVRYIFANEKLNKAQDGTQK